MKRRPEKSLVDRILADRAVRAEVATASFQWFFPIYFARRMRYESAPFHEELFRLLEDGSLTFTAVMAFRGSAKSTIITVAYVLWAVFGVQQKKSVVLVGQTEAKARRYLANIRRQLETNELLRHDLGPIDEERDQWGATALVIRRLGARIAVASVGQSVRGALHDEHRPDLFVLDDVEDLESVRTREGRDKLHDWFTSEVVPTGDRGTRFVVVGNMLHEDSLLKRLQRSIESGAVRGAYREYPIVDDRGDPLWPAKYPTQADIDEERARTMDPAAWAREYLLRIVSREDQVIKPEWVRRYAALPTPDFHAYFAIGIDLAISQKESADCTAMVAAQVQRGHGRDMAVYILPGPVNARLTSLETIAAAKALADSFGRRDCKIAVESNGYQQSLVEQLRSARYQAEGVPSRGDKRSRLAAVSFLVQSGQVLFPETGCEALLAQLLGFGAERHDDLADAFSILLAKVAAEWSRPHAFAVAATPEHPRPDAI